MLTLLIMLVGIVIGYFLFPIKWNRFNQIIQTVSIALLIFCMGVTLGQREQLAQEIQKIGIASLMFSIVPIIFSIILVYWFSKRWIEPQRKEQKHGNRRSD